MKKQCHFPRNAKQLMRENSRGNCQIKKEGIVEDIALLQTQKLRESLLLEEKATEAIYTAEELSTPPSDNNRHQHKRIIKTMETGF